MFATADHLEAVGSLLAVFVGDSGGAIEVVGEADLLRAVGVFAGHSSALFVVAPGGEAHAAVVGDAGE